MHATEAEEGIRLAMRLGISVPEQDQAGFAEALARLFDQAGLVLSLPLPPADGSSQTFEP